jgi:hypothetical protein
MISFRLSEELELFRRTATELARQKVRGMGRAAERGSPGLDQEYLDLGFGAIEVPEAFGGLGQGLLGRAVVEGALSYGDLGIALALPGIGPGAQAMLLLGDEAQKSSLLQTWVNRGIRSAIAWSEPKPLAGTFATVAKERADGSFELTGQKHEVVLGDRAGALIVFARLGDRPAAFAVETEPMPEGLRFDASRGDGLGLLAAPAVSLTLEGVRVPRDRMLAGADFSERVVEMFLRIGVVGAARAAGLAAAALDHATAYAAERTAFGKPIAQFQGLAFLVADMAIRVEVMNGLAMRAAWAMDHGAADRHSLAAAAVAECHEGAMWVATQAVQVLGGAGFVDDHPVEKWMRDAKAHMSYGVSHMMCDLLLGRLALAGGAPAMEHDAPMPGLQAVMT